MAKGKILLCFCLLLFCGEAYSQRVGLLTVDQLENRINAGNDTVYVVNFWATWCSPCVKELPYFRKLQTHYRLQPLKVIMVSVDFKSKLETAVKPFVKRHNPGDEVFLLDEKNQQEYIDKISKNWSGALPATLVVNKKRRIREFFEQEFTYAELDKLYQNLK